jgi:type IX secretion system PorP/SprF family membrane protein
MKNIQFFLASLLIIISLKLNAQDVHFSQLESTPLLHNPSFAGKSGGDIRAIVNYRTQWGSVTSSPFQSFGANMDMRFKNSRLNGSHLGGGISMYTDVAGASKMRTTLVNLTIAAHVKINSSSYLSAGLQGGFNQKSIDYNDLRFDSQFSGIGHNPELNSNEDLGSNSEMSPTISGGLSYMWSDLFDGTGASEGSKKINIGVAFHHYNGPRYYYVSEEDLGVKFIANFNSSFGLSSSPWVIKPAAYISLQNKATDIVFGSLFKYGFSEGSTSLNKSSSIAFGAYYRVADSFIPTVQVQWDSFVMGLSYDINSSKLSEASSSRGGFEISLKFISQNSTFGNSSKTRFF